MLIMEKKRKRFAALTLVFVCLLTFTYVASVFGQDNGNQDTASRNASILLTRLSAEEKVGQLFLVTMDGSTLEEDSPIKELIQNYHLGGVLLKKSNNNFTSSGHSLEETFALIKGIQQLEWQSTNSLIVSPQETSINDYVPLFIGISQSGDLYPDDQILNGLTPLPSQMSIGATWDANLSKETGVLLGKEMAALGFNLILNPSLDVLENPYGEGKGDLGVRTFGGDPFWVGEMGKAYVSGLHIGSIGKLAVIAKNFPGRGGSDRLPDEEVATVRKSLEQLKLIELAPFFEVTNIAETSGDAIVDGMLLSHIRFQGFQGNIRANTKPVSFDQSAVELLMTLNPFADWRQNGGVLISDDLGSPAVRKFFIPVGQSFDARQIARNAFLAGNDLLYMDQLLSTGDKDRFETYKKTIELFVQKYREDKAFADRVDASVLRILTLKYRIQPEFKIDAVIPAERGIINIGSGEETVYKVSSDAATLISPKIDQLAAALPSEPGINDKIVIFTDTLSIPQCATCDLQDVVSINEMQNVTIKLYGKAGSGQIQDQNIISYSFIELQDYINNPFNRVELETNLSRANWVIFIIHSQDPGRDGSYALHNLLAEKPEVIRNKNIVVFSFNAPYYYDATEISAFTAYYCLYTKIPSAFESAARLLFKEITPAGSSPVSISGTAYNIINATSPNPNQVIELLVEKPLVESGGTQESQTNGSELSGFKLGDSLPIKTGIILDQNDHPVPDGTVVKFMLSEQGKNLTIQQIESITKQGVARAAFILQASGLQEIRASTEPALNSQILLIDISQGNEAIISAITPTPIPTLTSDDQVPVLESQPQNEVAVEKKVNNRFLEWVLITVLAWFSGYLFYYNSTLIKVRRDRVLISCAIILGGLISGIWILVGLPGSFSRIGFSGYFKLFALIILVEVITGTVMWVFRNQMKHNKVARN
jgi:beta-N-acetylhexosaminidase